MKLTKKNKFNLAIATAAGAMLSLVTIDTPFADAHHVNGLFTAMAIGLAVITIGLVIWAFNDQGGLQG